MITVAGFNTAVDRRLEVPVLRPGEVHRAAAAQVTPGGKGLHVAQMIAELGEPVRLVGLEDEEHATALSQHLLARRVQWHGVRTSGRLRQCLAVQEANARVTEILEPGPSLDVGERAVLLDALLGLYSTSSVVVLSGSLPRGLASDTYAALVRKAAGFALPCLVDASGEALRAAVGAAPWCVKPNADEASALMERPLVSRDDAGECVRWLYAQGVSRPVVTLGAHGAIGFDGETVLHAWSDPADVRNPVGSGDCFLAGLAVGVARREPLTACMQLAVACGAACAETAETGFAERTRVREWTTRTRVEPLASPGATTAAQDVSGRDHPL